MRNKPPSTPTSTSAHPTAPADLQEIRDELSLADIVDVTALQELMDDFYAVAHIPMSLIDLRGNVLVGVGWQDICTHFHRVNEASCRHCLESDTELAAGLAQGESRLCKCKNNLWDMATPIVVGGRHVGDVYSGQFFFDDEIPDLELFREQARRFGFDEAAYLAALDRIPRLSRQTVDRGMGFFLKLALTLSRVGYSNVELARLLADRERLTRSLRESREDLNRAQEVGQIGSWRLDVRRNVLSWSDESYRIFGVPAGTALTYESFLACIHPDDRAFVDTRWTAGLRGEPYDVEHRIVADGRVKWVREKAYLEFDADRALLGGFGITQDITERKATEVALRESRQRLEASLIEKEVLLKEVHHRVKNNMQVISSIVSLQAEALPDGALRDAFGDIRDRVRSMALVHEKLYQSQSLALVDLSEYSKSLLNQLWRAHAASSIALRLALRPVALPIDQAVPFGLVLNELAGNALKHAFAGRAAGSVTVSLAPDEASPTTVRLAVTDDGVGLPAVVDWQQARSLGLRLVRMLAQQMKGSITSRASAAGGTTFELVFETAAA